MEGRGISIELCVTVFLVYSSVMLNASTTLVMCHEVVRAEVQVSGIVWVCLLNDLTAKETLGIHPCDEAHVKLGDVIDLVFGLNSVRSTRKRPLQLGAAITTTLSCGT